MASPIGGKSWCDQCESLQAPGSVAACRSQWCKLKKPGESIVVPPVVDVDPELAARAARRFNGGSPFKKPEAPVIEVQADQTPEPRRYRPRKPRFELTVREQRLLDNMRALAANGRVTASFADLMEGVASCPSSVSPVMGRLLHMGKVTIVERPGGRGKTTYAIEGIVSVEAVVTDPPPAPFAADNWVAAQIAGESCETCRFLHRGRQLQSHHCRRNPPTMGGFPPTQPGSWCGEYQKEANK